MRPQLAPVAFLLLCGCESATAPVDRDLEPLFASTAQCAEVDRTCDSTSRAVPVPAVVLENQPPQFPLGVWTMDEAARTKLEALLTQMRIPCRSR